MYLNISIPTPILNNISRFWTYIKGNKDVNKFTDSEFQNTLSISHLRIKRRCTSGFFGSLLGSWHVTEFSRGSSFVLNKGHTALSTWSRNFINWLRLVVF